MIESGHAYMIGKGTLPVMLAAAAVTTLISSASYSTIMASSFHSH